MICWQTNIDINLIHQHHVEQLLGPAVLTHLRATPKRNLAIRTKMQVLRGLY